MTHAPSIADGRMRESCVIARAGIDRHHGARGPDVHRLDVAAARLCGRRDIARRLGDGRHDHGGRTGRDDGALGVGGTRRFGDRARAVLGQAAELESAVGCGSDGRGGTRLVGRDTPHEPADRGRDDRGDRDDRRGGATGHPDATALGPALTFRSALPADIGEERVLDLVDALRCELGERSGGLLHVHVLSFTTVRRRVRMRERRLRTTPWATPSSSAAAWYA